METLLQVLLDGMLNGMLYALVAAGLCLIWGVMDVINFAHGEYLMVAMYVSYWLGFLAERRPAHVHHRRRALHLHPGGADVHS